MNSTLYEFGNFRLLRTKRELWFGETQVNLPRHTFECIDYLISNRDRVVGRDELIDHLFPRQDASDAQLGQIVLRARRAVGDDGITQNVIRTILGFGYSWVVETKASEPEAGRPENGRATDAQRTSSVDATPATPSGDRRAIEPGSPSHEPPRRGAGLRFLIASTLVMAIAVPAIYGILALNRKIDVLSEPDSHGTQLQAGAIVLPMDIQGQREDAWMKLGAMDLVANRLRDAGIKVLPSESVLALLSSSTGIESTESLAHRVAGVRLWVRGKAVRDHSEWRIELAASSEGQPTIPVAFSGSEALPTLRGATDLLLAALGHRQPVDGDHNEALEVALLRAKAALLANEVETARTILHDSRELAEQPAHLAFQLALVDNKAGRFTVAEAALSRFLEDPGLLTDRPLHARLLATRGNSRVHLGKFVGARQDFQKTLEVLGENEESRWRGVALNGRAIAFTMTDHIDEALADFVSARTVFASTGDELGVAIVDINLGLLEIERDRPAVGIRNLSDAVDRIQSFGAMSELSIALSGLTEAQLTLMDREAARATFERSWDLRERFVDPSHRIDLFVDKARILMGEGHYLDAREALDQASAIGPSENPTLRLHLRTVQADLALRLGEWTVADHLTEQALADCPSVGADDDCTEVLLLRQRALLQGGHEESARDLLDRSLPVPALPSRERGKAFEAIAMAEWALHKKEDSSAAAWLRFAMATAELRALPAEMVAVAAATVPLLQRKGFETQAAITLGRVAPWALRDFDSALLQVRLYHALGKRAAWTSALNKAEALAGERRIPPTLRTMAPDLADGDSDAMLRTHGEANTQVP